MSFEIYWICLRTYGLFAVYKHKHTCSLGTYVCVCGWGVYLGSAALLSYIAEAFNVSIGANAHIDFKDLVV